MRFEHVNTYPATAAEVLEMLGDADFRERVCEYIHATEYSVEVTGTGTGTEPTVVEVSQTQVARKIPSIAQKFVGDTVQIVQRETWTSVDAATFDMVIPGKPGQLRGTISLRERDGQCDEVFAGEVKVQVPLVGGKLESFVSDLLKKMLAAEGRVGVSWLEESRG